MKNVFMATVMGFVICGGMAHTEKANAAVDKVDRKVRYKIVMSENDKVCQPLVTAYNKSLVKYLGKPIPKDYYPYKGSATNFEIWDTSAFEEVGFTVLNAGAVSVDLFNDGQERVVFSYDNQHHSDLTTMMFLIKKGVAIDQVKDVERDSPLIERDVGYDGMTVEQETQPVHLRGEYVLEKHPVIIQIKTNHSSLNKIIREYNGPDMWLRAPMISSGNGGVTTRIVKWGGSTFVIMNNYNNLGYGKSYLNLYQLSPNGHNDVCYLSLEGK